MTDVFSFSPNEADPWLRPCIGCGEFFSPCRRTQLRCSPNCGDAKRKADRHTSTKDRHANRVFGERPFIGIDGEGGGTDDLGRQHYLLLGAADAAGKTYPLFNDNEPLRPERIFDFILSLPQNAYIVGFYFGYDITQILRRLPENRLQPIMHEQPDIEYSGQLVNGKERSRLQWTSWGNYELQWLPGHYLKVASSHRSDDGRTTLAVKGTTRTVYEVGGFFQCSFIQAISDWLIDPQTGRPIDDSISAETLALIAENKALRSQFAQITPKIRRYNHEECRLLAKMMERLRASALDCEQEPVLWARGIKMWPSRPWGAGALAARMHETAKTPQRVRPGQQRRDGITYLPERPAEFEEMATHAYYGGALRNRADGRGARANL